MRQFICRHCCPAHIRVHLPPPIACLHSRPCRLSALSPQRPHIRAPCPARTAILSPPHTAFVPCSAPCPAPSGRPLPGAGRPSYLSESAISESTIESFAGPCLNQAFPPIRVSRLLSSASCLDLFQGQASLPCTVPTQNPKQCRPRHQPAPHRGGTVARTEAGPVCERSLPSCRQSRAQAGQSTAVSRSHRRAGLRQPGVHPLPARTGLYPASVPGWRLG